MTMTVEAADESRRVETTKQLHEAATKMAASYARLEQIVRYARSQGMSLREIANAAGMSHETVRRLTR